MNDATERALATAVQAVLAILAAGVTPVVIPGTPAWVGLLVGVVLAVLTAIAKSLGVAAKVKQVAGTVQQTVDTVATAAQTQLTNTNIPVIPVTAAPVSLADAGHTEAQAAAPARAASVQMDQLP
jgi:hypothetical protein